MTDQPINAAALAAALELTRQLELVSYPSPQLDAAKTQAGAVVVAVSAIPEPIKDVRNYGAVEGGLVDATLAIQKAIDAGDGRVPAGRWLINPTRVASGSSFYGLLVGAGKRLEADPEAVFVVRPNSAPRNMCIRIDGGYMEGGQVLGDRLLHNYSSGGTHEWGYGVQLRGTDSKAVGVRVSQCTGDGFGLSGTRPVIEKCVSTQNRRQGVSIFGSVEPRISDCEFSWTGALNGQAGTNPRCGVDFEPDAGNPSVINPVLENCTISNNEVTGLVAWIRSEVIGGAIKNLVARGNKISGSPNAVHMKAFVGAIQSDMTGNSVKRGGGSGLRIESGAVVSATGNTFAGPKPRIPAFTTTGTDSRTKYDINQLGGKVNAGTNSYV